MALGIPSLPNATPLLRPALLVADAIAFSRAIAQAKWGVYYKAKPVVIPDSIVAIDYKKDWQIPNYPQEEGAFESYNKVRMPFQARVRLTKGGLESTRAEFLRIIDDMASSLNLYSMVTPEVTYNNCNVTHYDYKRTSSNGVTLITVDLWLVEIRNTATAQFSNTASPSGQDPTATNVQVESATTSEAAAVSKVQ